MADDAGPGYAQLQHGGATIWPQPAAAVPLAAAARQLGGAGPRSTAAGRRRQRRARPAACAAHRRTEGPEAAGGSQRGAGEAGSGGCKRAHAVGVSGGRAARLGLFLRHGIVVPSATARGPANAPPTKSGGRLQGHEHITLGAAQRWRSALHSDGSPEVPDGPVARQDGGPPPRRQASWRQWRRQRPHVLQATPLHPIVSCIPLGV